MDGYEEVNRVYGCSGLAPCITARDYKDPPKILIRENRMEVVQIGNIAITDTGGWENPQRGRIYSVQGLCPCLNTVSGGNLEPKIISEVTDEQDKQIRQHPPDKDQG